MKILILSFYPPYVIGGGEVVAQRLAEGLLAKGHDVVVVSPSRYWRVKTQEVNGVKVYYVPTKNIYFSTEPKKRPAVVKAVWHALDSYNPFMARSLERILETERPQVVNTQNVAGFSSAAWGAVKRRGIALVNTVHSYTLLCPRQLLRGGELCSSTCFECRMHRYPRRRLSRHVDVATGVSKFIIERYDRERFFPTAEKMLIYNSSESAHNGAAPPRVNGPLRFGFLGRLHPVKGVDLLIRSFLDLPEGQAELLIAGNGTPEYELSLRKLAGSRRDIRWLGFVPGGELLRQVDVVAVPSLWHDPAPLVVREALGHGVPVIGARRGGIPELMGERAGWVFEPEEPNALTNAMREAIESRNELARMGDRAIQWARGFTNEAMVDGYVRAYNYAIEKNAKNS
jgi:glycosyltransferase involved in cell wall biosynthesis